MNSAALLFDLDGTIIDTEPVCMDAFTQVCRGYGITLDAERYRRVVGHSWEAAARILGEGLSFERQRTLLAEVLDLYDQLLAEQIPTIPGALELLSSIEGRVHLALVTGSTSSQARTYLGKLGVLGCFNTLVTEGDYPRSKPAPDAYLLAMQRLQVTPERCLVFEDSAPGIAAGRAAGARVVAIEHANHFQQDQSDAHHRLPDLRGIDLGWCLRQLGL